MPCGSSWLASGGARIWIVDKAIEQHGEFAQPEVVSDSLERITSTADGVVTFSRANTSWPK